MFLKLDPTFLKVDLRKELKKKFLKLSQLWRELLKLKPKKRLVNMNINQIQRDLMKMKTLKVKRVMSILKHQRRH
jgi:hypothetical protein